MTKRILIDASNDQETRIASIQNDIIEDFEYEVVGKKQLRGNVYLARVSRVEPSLQAAFVEYGGNRQGFLAFSEIHPDYYRIPVEDRAKLLETVSKEVSDDDEIQINNDENVDDEFQENKDFKKIKNKLYKNYKIQEVISKGQIILVQIVKEERGNKGAALTSYLSLAGRYCVLMPNTPRGGGISRKISTSTDRQRLKKVLEGLNLDKGMALIIRTAGSKRTKVEIKRDFQNLISMWEDIKNKTIKSNAPNLIHDEGSIIKRAVRDMYNSDVEEILVQGELAFKTCKSYMKSLMPSHTKKIHQYTDDQVLLFQKFGIDTQLSDIFKPIVNLKSGGYLVINHTEALVAVDVNSGKATRERSIEKTAFQTNLEAAEEFARQAKLRDLSGLIVIDFIDMEDYKNRNTIERKLKEAFKQDRARIQIGEISSFGLLELSRQRLRLSVSETTTEVCNFCGGVGRIQSSEVTSMQILREAEDSLVKNNQNEISISIHSSMSAYILNNKKQNIFDIENRHKAKIIFNIDNNLTISDYKLENSEDRKIVDLKAENQHKDKISKKRKNQKKSRDNNDTLNETNTVLDKKKDPSLIEKKNKKGPKKAKRSKKERQLRN
ncbi:MAG: hypothetical protein CM15mP67_13540 [Alphaproteobacteria bacterium]|nr:MAG: hypothetical protein CM15mP67_13540 [Alphaproteobacteria bacterium]